MLRLNGFDWDSRETAWHEQYGQLVAFAELHGHVKIPIVGMARLCKWLNDQRWAYHQLQQQQEEEEDEEHGSSTTTTFPTKKVVVVVRSIPPERIGLLEQVPGCEWNPFEAAWQKPYHELVDYHTTHGHCLVPHTYSNNQPLGKWVARQRQAYKRYVSPRQDDSPTTPTTSAAARTWTKTAEMTPERIALLNQIDFVWSWKQKKKRRRRRSDNNKHRRKVQMLLNNHAYTRKKKKNSIPYHCGWWNTHRGGVWNKQHQKSIRVTNLQSTLLRRFTHIQDAAKRGARSEYMLVMRHTPYSMVAGPWSFLVRNFAQCIRVQEHCARKYMVCIRNAYDCRQPTGRTFGEGNEFRKLRTERQTRGS